MRDTRVKNNYFTKPDRRPPKSPDKGEIEKILKLYGRKEFPYTALADICGAKIELRTNSRHVYEYWKLNWFSADKDDRCYWSYANSRVMFPRDRFPMLIKDAKGNLVEALKGEKM